MHVLVHSVGALVSQPGLNMCTQVTVTESAESAQAMPVAMSD
jgi:hypothetical protein